MDGRLDGVTLRFGANRAQPLGGWALFTRRSVRIIFPAVQEVNCPEGARETTLGCAAGKNDSDSFRRGGNRAIPQNLTYARQPRLSAGRSPWAR